MQRSEDGNQFELLEAAREALSLALAVVFSAHAVYSYRMCRGNCTQRMSYTSTSDARSFPRDSFSCFPPRDMHHMLSLLVKP